MFRFYDRNLIDSSNISLASFTSGSGTAHNLVDRKFTSKWVTVGNNSDTSTVTASFVFDSSTSFSGIFLCNHNIAAMKVTAATGTLLATLSGNAYSNTFIVIPSTSATTGINLYISNTFPSNTEKSIGELFVTKGLLCEFYPPDSSQFKQTTRTIGFQRELIDGGIINIRLSKKYACDMNLGLISSTTMRELTTVWDNNKDFLFVPFPVNTFTAEWNGQCESVVWVGDRDIENFKDNNIVNGYNGSISLRQIPD
jgi:hypothetical protein